MKLTLSSNSVPSADSVPSTNTVPSERAFVMGLIGTGLIILIIALFISISYTWFITRGDDPAVHIKAVRTSMTLPLIIVPLCVALVTRRAFADFRRLNAVSALAHTDDMTQLANRRAFMRHAESVFASATLDRQGLCVFIVDLDHFKRVNDAHGHQAGDVVLTHAARQILTALPGTAFVARLGGEEFGVLAPYETISDVYDMAESIRQEIVARPCPFGLDRIRVTASVGVGIVHPQDTVGSVLSRADAALYEAKNEGRNRFVVAA